MSEEEDYNNDIAVVGMSGAFPEADSIDLFWDKLMKGESGIKALSDDDLKAAGVKSSLYQQPDYVKKAACVSSAKSFDATFFGYTNSEAEIMDPQHRLFLEHSWAALESAGFIPGECEDSIGVYAGCSLNRYLLNNLDINTKEFGITDFQNMLASEKDFLSTRVSYKLNLKGPSINVQSACSTSLVAIQLGILSLQMYQCDVALCGGVTLNVPHGGGYLYSEGMIYSKVGRCSPFSSAADGTLFGEGVGVVVLKRLADAIEDKDNILAVVKGAAVNNDGSSKVGFTAPSVNGQAEVVSLAQDLAGLGPNNIDFIETHGTATKMGDPIELAGLQEAFKEAKYTQPFCALGTLKANIGHLDAAAGVAAFIKSVMVVNKKLIPPNMCVDGVYPNLDQADTPFYFNQSPVDLTHRNDPVHAGVSSFGVGGTNAHVILASPPQATASETKASEFESLLFFTAKTSTAATALQDKTLEYLNLYPDKLFNAGHTLLNTRKIFEYRTWSYVTSKGGESIYSSNSTPITPIKNPSVAFMFPGQGSQYIGMAKKLYEEHPEFKAYLNDCLDVLSQVTDKNIKNVVLGGEGAPEDLLDTDITQLSLFVVEYALAQSIMAVGIKPELLIGHSIGEYVAACLAGVFDLKSALKIVDARGTLMSKTDVGAMLAIFTERDSLEDLLFGSLSISVQNSEKNIVVSGVEGDIQALEDKLKALSIGYSRLATKHPFHSSFMDPILDEFAKVFEGVKLSEPNVSIVSCTKNYIDKDLATKEYWVDHLRSEVNFHKGVEQGLLSSSVNIVLEVGPGSVLTSLVSANKLCGDLRALPVLPSAKLLNNSAQTFANAIAALWASGVAVDLTKTKYIHGSTREVLPTYQFDTQIHWLNNTSSASRVAVPKLETSKEEEAPWTSESVSSTVLKCWQSAFGKDDILLDANFFEMGGDSLLTVRLSSLLADAFGIQVPSSNIFSAPTVELTIESIKNQLLEQAPKDTPASCLFKVDGRGSKTPLFLVAGAHEDQYYAGAKNFSCYEESFYRYFSNFVKYMDGKRPVYGFKPRGITYKDKMHQSVEEMAATYILEMKTVQPEGPYFVGGECVGGTVAYEMARQLKANNEEVLFLLLMDTVLPTNWVRLRETSLVKYRRVKRDLMSLMRNVLSGNFTETPRLIGTSLYGCICYFLPITESLRQSRRARFGSQKYLSVLLGYRAKPIDVNGALLINKVWKEQYGAMGWTDTLVPQFDIVGVSGDHKTRLTTGGKELGQMVNTLVARHEDN